MAPVLFSYLSIVVDHWRDRLEGVDGVGIRVIRIPLMLKEVRFVQWMSYLILGSLISASGRIDVDVDRKVAQASNTFGVLRKGLELAPVYQELKIRISGLCIVSVIVRMGQSAETVKSRAGWKTMCRAGVQRGF